MPAPQFILNYTGGKYPESKHTQNIDINYLKYDTIVEPFGGSFGFSRFVFYKLGHTHLKYKVYDADKGLIDFYNHLKQLIIEDKHEAFFEEYRKEAKKLHDACYYRGTQLNTKKLSHYFNTYKHPDLFIQWCIHKNHVFINSTIRRIAYKRNAGFTEIFKHTDFICCKCEDIPADILYNDTTLVYLDPPYLVTNNSTYDTQFDLNTVFETIERLLSSADCLLVHQYNFLLCRAFKDFNTFVYKKTYGSAKIVDHVIFYRLSA